MPIYEYFCNGCNKAIEVLQKISDAPLTHCPECRGEVKKMISRTSFQLKGTGWYATDYKKPGSGTGPSGSGGGAAGGSSSGSEGGGSPPPAKGGGDSGGSTATSGSTSAAPAKGGHGGKCDH